MSRIKKGVAAKYQKAYDKAATVKKKSKGQRETVGQSFEKFEEANPTKAGLIGAVPDAMELAAEKSGHSVSTDTMIGYDENIVKDERIPKPEPPDSYGFSAAKNIKEYNHW